MPGFFRVIFEQIIGVLKELSIVQRITLLLLGIVIFVSLFALTMWGTRPDYIPLYSGLSQQDAGEVVKKLAEKNIEYKLGGDGSSILVPSKVARQLRVELATDGLPKGSGFGYELFDTFKLGMTEFTQKVNYQRAIETELARTIASLEQVKAARVHIVLQEESLFVNENDGASASLVVDIVGNKMLSSDQINGIVHLVASSVKGLSPKNVTIIDTNGNVLYSYTDEDGLDLGLSMKQVEAQKKYEKMIQSRIGSMLAKVFGENASVVRVNIEMNYDKSQTESETFIPAETPIIRSEKAVEEGYKGTGVPGNVNVPAQGAGQNSTYTKLDETKNYEVSKKVEHFTKTPGQIVKMSIAVILDRKVSDEERTNLIDAISSAAGISQERGDVLTLSSFEFNKTTLEQDKLEMEKATRNDMIMNIAKNVGLGILLLVTFLYARRSLKKLSSISTAGGSWGVNVGAGRKNEIPNVVLEEQEELSPEDQKRVAMKNTLVDMVQSDPDVFAKILRRWLTED
ncbi:MAG: flagellar M-ring protein FliF [Candidatus Margulisbacteria bacterium GWF2_35_9]|nr:MAG: flagellar M-ring protein FliF [Candidatus Margulisbacteria bacterium GWF2_35_9]